MTGTLTVIWQLTLRNLKRVTRTRQLVMSTLIQPIIWMAIFSQSFRRIADFPQFARLGYSSYVSFFLPSIMVLIVLNGSVQSGISIISDLDTGVMDKLLTNPIRRSTILIGRALTDAITMCARCLVVLAIAFAMGATAKTGVGGILIALTLTIMLGACAAGLSNFVALRTRNAEVTMIVGMVTGMPLLFLSPAFFPKELQPQWIQDISVANPVAYVVSTGQQVINISVQWDRVALTVGVLALALLIVFSSATRAFRRLTI